MKNSFLMLILVINFANAQNSKVLSGKIIVKDGSPSGVLVLNLVTEKETLSNFEGQFKIEGKVDDLLVFQNSNLEYQRKSIDEADFEKGFMVVEMVKKNIQLDEIKIFNYSRMNAVSMGILSTPAKTYTPAQRKLKTATSLDPSFNIGSMAGFGMSLDPLFNAISGRTKMLKKFVAIESVQLRVQRLQNWFSNDYLINDLKINENLLKGFLFYASEDAQVINGLRSKNQFLTSFALIDVAKRYNALQK